MQGSYWNSVLNNRLSRRRALAATGGLGAAAAFLAACGGGDSKSDDGGNKSSLVTDPVDTTKQAKRGGTLKWFAGNEPAHLDVQLDQAPMNQHKNMVYGHLVNVASGLGKPPSFEGVAPEMAESWEYSPDRLQVTFKLRQGVKFHNKPPVNGRLMTSADVVFSMDRLAAKGTDRKFLFNSASPDAPVLSVTATDDKTVVFKLKEPVVFLLSALTPTQTGRPSIIPKETDSSFDIRGDMIGTGPFMLDKWQPSIGFSYNRNPDYYDKNYPLIDRIEMPTVLEYSQALAQLKTGGIYTYSSGTSAVRSEDLLPLKRDVPALQMYVVKGGTTPPSFANSSNVFGYSPSEVNKPLKDERVRQAISMSWDRDAWIDTFYNISSLQGEGLPVDSYWATALNPGGGSWWLDPKSKDFGPNAKYYMRDVAEAKKLLAAAGYGSGFEMVSSYIGGTQLGADHQRRVQVMESFGADIGIKYKDNVVDYTTFYIPTVRDSNGKFDGMGFRAGGASAAEAAVVLSGRYHSKFGAQAFAGFDAAGKGDASGDPALDALIGKLRTEADTEKRRALVFDAQRQIAKSMWDIPFPGIADAFYLTWPIIGNFMAFQGDRREKPTTWWLDETKPPVGKA